MAKDKNLIKKIAEKLQELKNNYEENKKWKLYLYLNGQCVKCLKIDKDFAPMNKFYKINVKHCKHLIGTNRKTQIIVTSSKYKMTDEKLKEAHIEVIIYEGSNITL